jgi:general secretion pathway protein E
MSVTTVAGNATAAPTRIAGTKGAMLDVTNLPAEKAVNALIEHAVGMKASDLFFATNEQHVAVLVRHLGIIRPIAILPSDLGKKCLSHIKAASGMDLSESRRPTDGRWIIEPEEKDETVDLRINAIPTMHGQDFAIRMLVRGATLFDLNTLGMMPDQLDQFEQMLIAPGGLILITGPTGSGKTATLYAALTKLNDGKKKINTIEDPIEYALPGLRQSQVNSAIELGFPELLRSVLRQSPDVIMIGEIRDAETAKTAVHAANSGILVLATIHAPNAPGAIQSMRSLDVHAHFLANCLRGVLSQRLVRTLCTNCRASFDLSGAEGTFDDISHLLAKDEGKKLYAPVGCETCDGAGYAGRTGVFELLTITKNIRNAVSDGRPTREIRTLALEEKMKDFRQSALLKVARGETTTEEIFRVVPAEHLISDE